MILLIDNYDSFAHNLARYFRQLGQEVTVIRNDEWTLDEVAQFEPKAIVISPGPCTPNEAGICLDVVSRLCNTIPIFGVCLGHQVICQALGGSIVRAKPLHGQASEVIHNEVGLFSGIPSPMRVGRYHSLAVEGNSIPDSLNIIASTTNQATNTESVEIAMAVEHKSLPTAGVQFHPESILTEHGYRLLANFLRRCDVTIDEARVASLGQMLAEQIQPANGQLSNHSTETVTPHGWS